MHNQNLNIMLIDDDEASHLIHSVAIEDAGIDLSNVYKCFNVDQAIRELVTIIDSGTQDKWPSYIFLDINMPRKNGYDFITEFKMLDQKFSTPIIYLVSSSINPKDEERADKLELVHGFKSKFVDKEFIKSLIASKSHSAS